ncbi:MAG: TIR domain-containing protein [Prevotella sp.]|nr:TIR domain-containing protein [Prevotella sp.]
MREYVGFISYRHLKQDSAVAVKLHRRLEHYRVPSDLVQNKDKRKLGYIFRDNDELPVSSNLSDNIYEALDHSHFLIVICTPETPKSLWVQREVEYFLQHHDRDHVLAVLVEGKPEESFLKAMLEVKDSEGNVVDYIEPLAANLTEDKGFEKRRQFRKESLRIIATLLGCPYDDLYQRDRRYRRKRIIISVCLIISILLSFIGLTVWKNIQISNEREQKRLKESELMVSDALLAYEAGDIPTAVSRAVGVLSMEEPPTPTQHAEAERVLNDVLMPYSIYVPHLTHMMIQRSDIEAFELSDDGSIVITVDRFGAINAFNTISAEHKWSVDGIVQYDSTSRGVRLFVNSSQVIVTCLGELRAFDVETGIPIWVKHINAEANCDYSVLSESGELLAVAGISDDGWRTLYILSTKTGEVLKTVTLAQPQGFSSRGFPISARVDWCPLGVFSKDDRYFYGYYYLDNELRYYCVDMETNTFKICFIQAMKSDRYFYQEEVFGMWCLGDDGQLLIIRHPSDERETIMAEIIDMVNGEQVTQERIRFDSAWTSEYSNVSARFAFTGHYLYGAFGKYFFALDIENRCWDSQLLDSDIIYLVPYPLSSQVFSVITSNGEYYLEWFNNGEIASGKTMLECITLEGMKTCKLKDGGMIELLEAEFEEVAHIQTDVIAGKVVGVSSKQPNRLCFYQLNKRPKRENDNRIALEADDASAKADETVGVRYKARITSDGMLAVSDKENDETVWTKELPFTNSSVRQMTMSEDEKYLIIITLDNRVLLYETTSGERLFYKAHDLVKAAGSIHDVVDVKTRIEIILNTEESRLYMYDVSGQGDGLCIDTTAWIRTASIPGMCNYNDNTNTIYICDIDGYVYGFQEYSINQLIRAAKSIRIGMT